MSGLRIINVSDPKNPRETGNYNTPGYAEDVFVAENYAYVADNVEGLRIVNERSTDSTSETGNYSTYGFIEDTFVTSTHAYVADERFGLRILDIGVPYAPLETGFYRFPDGSEAVGVFVSGNYAYVADNKNGLRIIDVSNPYHPAQTALFDTPVFPEQVFVSDNFAYIAEYGGLRIVDVSDPFQPSQASFFSITGTTLDVFISDKTAYVAAGSSGLVIVDVTNPHNPAPIASVNIAYAESVHVEKPYAYVADAHRGIQVIDISRPDSPQGVETYDTPGYAQGVFAFSPYLFVADSYKGLLVLDASNPQSLSPLANGTWDTAGESVNVFFSQNHIYLSDGGDGSWSGLSIFRFIERGIIDVYPTNIQIREGSGQASFTIRLGSAPTASVTIGLKNTNPGEIALSREQVILDSTNWQNGVDVTINPADDALKDGPQKCAVLTDPAQSTDPDYNGTDAGNVFVSVIDDETTVYIDSVYPSFGVVQQPLTLRVTGKGFVKGSSRVFISEYPGGTGETELTANTVFNSDTNLTITVPSQTAGHYNLKITAGADSDEMQDAFSFSDSASVSAQRGKKAIIVAAGARHLGNKLWHAVNNCADLAYETLIAQGFRPEDVLYLSASGTDATGEGNNDVDGSASVENLSYGLKYWAKNLDDPNDPGDTPPGRAAEKLVLFMIGHGKKETFFLNSVSASDDKISAQTLDAWLDDLQDEVTQKVIFVYDASMSGSFLPVLKPPAGKERIVLSGTSARERAWFLDDGEISFSWSFWRTLYYRDDVHDAFRAGKSVMESIQTPLIDINGDGAPDELLRKRALAEEPIGRGKDVGVSPPALVSVTADPAELNGNTTSDIIAEVTDNSGSGIESVWSRIFSPDVMNEITQDPVLAVPTVSLTLQGASYQSSFSGFNLEGEYLVFFHALDKSGLEAIPNTAGVIQNTGVELDICDFDQNGSVDLTDAVIAMKAIAGMDTEDAIKVKVGLFDVDGDGKIGPQEMVYVLRETAGL